MTGNSNEPHQSRKFPIGYVLERAFSPRVRQDPLPP